MAAGKVLRAAALAALAAGAFLSLAAADLALRARSALREAEKYAAMTSSPAAGLPSPSASGRESALLAARRDYLASQSPAKMAYIWYKSAAEDFAFPGNPWAARARARLPGALAAWRADLAARGIKAEPWMTE